MIGVEPKSPAYRAVFAAVAALSSAEQLPGVADDETRFSPTKAYVRRVTGHNVWLLYRFDDDHVYLLTTRGEPPIPIDD